MTDQTPEARLAAALHETARKNHNLGEGPMRSVCLSAYSHEPRARAILAADPTLAADLALAEKVRGLFSRCSYHQGWDDECGQPEADPIHPSTNERMGNDQHVFRNDWVDMKVAAIIEAAKEASE